MTEHAYLINLVAMLRRGFNLRDVPFIGNALRSPQSNLEEAFRHGYNGAQILPLRGLRIDECCQIAAEYQGILVSQGPWNAVPTLFHALMHVPGTLGVRSEKEDWLVSPMPWICRRMIKSMIAADIPRIYHDFDHEFQTTKCFAEVNPGMGLAPAEIVEKCEEVGCSIALDTAHLRRPIHNWEIELLARRRTQLNRSRLPEDWHESIRVFAPLIEVVHVHPTEDLDAFLRDPAETETGKIVQAVLEVTAPRPLRLIAEYNPGIGAFLRPELSHQLAEQALESMHRLCE